MMRYFKTFIALLLFESAHSFAFSQEVRGRVLEKDATGVLKPLPGANILWRGTTIGVSSNNNGEFTIKRLAGSDYLVISFVGYNTDTVAIAASQQYIEHTLTQSVVLDGVVVEGRAKGSYFDRLNPIQTQVVSKHELKRAACCNLSESFETNASVDVSYSDAVTGARQIQLLGLSGTYTQLQAENIPILRGLGSTFGLSYVPGSWMESIQISKGTASVANGYESITGQINIEYKKPWGEERFHANAYLNELGMVEANFNLGGDLNDKVSTMILAHAENFENRIDHNSDSFLDHPLVRQYHLFNRWKYQGEHLESQVGIKILSEERIAGQSAYRPYMEQSAFNPFGIDINTRRYEGFAKTGYVFHRPSTSLGIILSASLHDQQSVFGLRSYNANQQSLYANLIFITYLFNTNHTFKTGANFNFDNYSELFNTLNFDRVERVPGVYLEYTYKWLERLTLMAGIRYDYHSRFKGFVTPRVHVFYKPINQLTLRGSMGKGYRTPSVLSENSFLFASSRSFIFDQNPGMEEAWNYGLNVTQRYKVFGRELAISTDYYRTNFINQYVVDLERNILEVHFYNLKGRSYSNSFQVETTYQPFNRFDVTAAYRVNDVRVTIDGVLQSKPLVSRYKGLLSLSYKTPLRKWQLDYTVHLNGGGRLPSTVGYPPSENLPVGFPSYSVMSFQVTKLFRKFDLYLGVENLTGFKQHSPIIFAADPYSPYFDASRVWGPVTGRKVYAGFRMTVWK